MAMEVSGAKTTGRTWLVPDLVYAAVPPGELEQKEVPNAHNRCSGGSRGGGLVYLLDDSFCIFLLMLSCSREKTDEGTSQRQTTI